MSAFELSQLLMLVAILLDIVGLCQPGRRSLLGFVAIGCLCSALHFALLQQWTACGMASLTTIRFAVARSFPIKSLAAAFLILQTITCVFTFERPINLLAFTGSVCGTIASFHPDVGTLRKLLLVASSLWLIHNYLVWTPVGILAEAIFLGVNVYAVLKSKPPVVAE